MKAFLFISIIFSFLSCSKENNENKSDKLFAHLDVGIGFRITDNDGMGLLDRSNPNRYTENDIAIGTIDSKGNFTKDKRTDLFSIDEGYSANGYITELNISLPYPQVVADKNKIYTVHFKIADNPIDTLKVDYLMYLPDNINRNNYSGGSIVKNNVWLNGKLIWTREMEEKAIKNNDYTDLIKNITLIKVPNKQ